MLQKKDISIRYTQPIEDDEKGSNGLWDLSGEIALDIGLYLKQKNWLKPCNNKSDTLLFADELGQEQIYNILTQYLEVQNND